MKVDHNFHVIPYSLAEGCHEFLNMIKRAWRCRVVRIRDEDDLHRPVPRSHHCFAGVGEFLRLECLVYGTHIAKAKVCINLQAVAGLSAEQAPNWNVEALTEYIPQRLLDAADSGHADDAQPPEAHLGHRPHSLLDVARIPPQKDRGEILDSTGNTARFPLQRCFAP